MPSTHWHGRDSHGGLPYKDKGIFTLLQSDASTTTVAFPGVKAEFLGAPGHFPLPISGNLYRSLSLDCTNRCPGRLQAISGGVHNTHPQGRGRSFRRSLCPAPRLWARSPPGCRLPPARARVKIPVLNRVLRRFGWWGSTPRGFRPVFFQSFIAWVITFGYFCRPSTGARSSGG